jgi:hypothetical protein
MPHFVYICLPLYILCKCIILGLNNGELA